MDRSKSGSLKDSYRFDEKSKKGAMSKKGEMSNGLEIHVEELEEGVSSIDIIEDSRKRSVNFDHPNIFPCIGTDHSNIIPRTLYLDYTDSLHNYIISKKTFKKSFIRLPVNDDTRRHAYEYISDELRNIIRGAIQAILYLHQKKLSLLSLTMNNFKIRNGKVGLYDLSLVDYVESTTARNDFIRLSDIFTNLLGGLFEDQKNIPGDLQHLFKCMNNYSEGDSILLLNHLAVLTTKDRLRVIKGYFNHQYSASMRGTIQGFLRDMDKNGPNPRILFAELKAMDAKFGDAVLRCSKKNEADVNKYGPTNSVIIKLARDMVTHLPEHIKNTTYLGEKQGCRDIDVELSVMSIFWEHLVVFQEKAKKFLHHLV